MDALATNMGRGLPLTLVALLSVIVLIAWLRGGVGQRSTRLALGLPYAAVLVACWLTLLLRPDGVPNDDWLLWFTFALTAIAFALPVLWRRCARRKQIR